LSHVGGIAETSSTPAPLPLGKLQALPTDEKPIVRWNDRDEAFQEVVKDIMRVVSSLRESREETFLSLKAQKAQLDQPIGPSEQRKTYHLYHEQYYYSLKLSEIACKIPFR
jgi:hypothetical protein